MSDVLDDALIPFRSIHLSTRYAEAQAELVPGVRFVVGHSLGAATAARLAEQNPSLQARLYGAPRISWSRNTNNRIQSWRHFGDPISLFDRGARSTIRLGNPHSYDGN